MNRTLYFVSAILLLLTPVIINLIFWNQIPDTVPIHWNLQGEADNFARKEVGMFIAPVLGLGLFLLFHFLPKLDPKKKVPLFHSTLQTITIGMLLFIVLLYLVTFLITIEVLASNTDWIFIVVMGLMVFFGNLLGKTRPNYFIGVRTPWTLENEKVWNKTHRVTGYIWVLASLAMIPLKLTLDNTAFLFIGISYFVVIIGFPLIYSYIVYNNVKNGAAG